MELTQIGHSFHQAWQRGLEELGKFSGMERRERIVLTAQAWQRYPATSPSFSGSVKPLVRRDLEESFATQYTALQEMIEAHIDETYVYPLKANPDDDVLRTRLLKVYLGLHQVDVAISTASTYLLDEGGDKTATYNHLGNAYAMKGDMTQAALNYKQAAALLPEDKGIRRNLAQALQALGRAQSAEPNSVEIAATGGEAPRGAAEIGVESFYWME